MKREAKAITFEEFARHGGGGGNGGPREGGPLSRFWQRWAKNLIQEKIETLDGISQLTPRQFIDRQNLLKEFDRVAEDSDAAYNAVLTHSRVFNHPVIKALIA